MRRGRARAGRVCLCVRLRHQLVSGGRRPGQPAANMVLPLLLVLLALLPLAAAEADAELPPTRAGRGRRRSTCRSGRPPAPAPASSYIVPSADLAPFGIALAVFMLGGCGPPDRFRGSGASPRTPLWLPQRRGNGSLRWTASPRHFTSQKTTKYLVHLRTEAFRLS